MEQQNVGSVWSPDFDKRPPRLAVYIDADNTSHQHIPAILAEITKYGEAAVRRAFGDFNSQELQRWPKVLNEHGIRPVHHPPQTAAGKNASDIALVIDAVETVAMHSFQGVVLVSSDADFTLLAIHLREKGLYVLGIGQKKTPISFRRACKNFVLIENIIGATLGEDLFQDSVEHLSPKQLAQQALPAILEVFQEDDSSSMALSVLGDALKRRNPEWDVRNYDCEQLSVLLRRTNAFHVDRTNGVAIMKTPMSKRLRGTGSVDAAKQG